MSEQGFSAQSGDAAYNGWIASVSSIVSGCLEIHMSEVMRRKYGDNKPDGPMIITLPDNTITGHIAGVFRYIGEILGKRQDIGMSLVDYLISEIKKIDIEMSEDDV